MDRGMETILRMMEEHSRNSVQEMRQKRYGWAKMHVHAALGLVQGTTALIVQGTFRPSERQIRRFAGLAEALLARNKLLLTRNGAANNPSKEDREVAAYVDKQLRTAKDWLERR